MYVASRTNPYLSIEITDEQADALTEWDRAVCAHFDEHGTYEGSPPYPAGCPTDVALPLHERDAYEAAELARTGARLDFERDNPGYLAAPPPAPVDAYREELARCAAGAVPR